MHPTPLVATLALLVMTTIAWCDDPKRTEAKPAEPKLRLLVPAYFYPAGERRKLWDEMNVAAARVPIVAIANPASGPGTARDPNYTDVIGQAQRAGVTIIGYVTTSYAKRAAAEVARDVDRWLELYPTINGVFFDEQTSDAAHVDYYLQLASHVRRRINSATIVSNPGTICAPEYVAKSATDAACLFENKSGFDTLQLPAWVRDYPSRRFVVLPYNVAAAEQMRRFVDDAVRRNIGYIYVTDRRGVNPWDGLPSYWADEVQAVHQINAGR